MFYHEQPRAAASRPRHAKTRECAIEELLTAAEKGLHDEMQNILDGVVPDGAAPPFLLDPSATQWSARRLAMNIRTFWPRWGAEAEYTALHCSAATGRLSVCALLLEHGANPNARSRHGVTPLMLAAFGGHVAVVELLLRRGAEPDAAMHGIVPDHSDGPCVLHLACACQEGGVTRQEHERSAAIVGILLGAGAPAHPRCTPLAPSPGLDPLEMLSPLHLAAANHNAEAVRLLIAEGAWVQHPSPMGLSALGLARYGCSDPRCASILLSLRDSPSSQPWHCRHVWSGAATVRELCWVPAVRTLWCSIAASPTTDPGSVATLTARGEAKDDAPIRLLTPDALRLVCQAVVMEHAPVDAAEPMEPKPTPPMGCLREIGEIIGALDATKLS